MCTGVRFNDKNGNMYFGRNLDWSTGYGEKVVITPRGYRYQTAFGAENQKSFAIIGMGIVAEGVPLYFDCANEAGLAVAGLNFPSYTKYSNAPVDGKTNVAAYEFPLWVVRNFETIDEVKEALKNVVIVARPINNQYPVSELHWLIGDKTSSIVVEYTANGMEIFENPVDVLANQPGYGWHFENLRNYLNLSPQMPQEIKWGAKAMRPFGTGVLLQGLPGDTYSPSRFVRAAYFNTHYPVQQDEKSNVLRLFHTLAGVAMIEGASEMADGSFEKTIYTGGYSSAAQTYYYNTYEDLTIRSVSLKEQKLGLAELIIVDK